MISLLLLFAFFVNFSNGQELDAIVMPFHKKQLNNLLFNLESWNTFNPTRTEKQVELVFFNSGPMDPNLEQEIMKFFQQNPSIANNFSNISVQFAQLIGFRDSYFRGTRTMFESLLFSLDDSISIKKSTLKYRNPNVNYVFYMEPDCFPVQQNWLDALHEEIKALDGKFWMLGSKFTGEIRWVGNKRDDFIYHLNGNSVYNIGSKEFRQFYLEKVISSYKRNELVPYDLKISEVLYKNNRELFNKFGTMFVATRVIVNTGGSNIQNFQKQNNQTFLQHICDNLKDYWRFYESILPANNQKLIEKMKELLEK